MLISFQEFTLYIVMLMKFKAIVKYKNKIRATNKFNKILFFFFASGQFCAQHFPDRLHAIVSVSNTIIH